MRRDGSLNDLAAAARESPILKPENDGPEREEGEASDNALAAAVKVKVMEVESGVAQPDTTQDGDCESLAEDWEVAIMFMTNPVCNVYDEVQLLYDLHSSCARLTGWKGRAGTFSQNAAFV